MALEQVAAILFARGRFTLVNPMLDRRSGHSATLLADGRVLVASGSTTEIFDPPTGTFVPASRNSAEIFDPATETFAHTGNMTAARLGHRATRLADGRVFISGGSTLTITHKNERGRTVTTPTSVPLSSTEFFDPAAGRFTAGPEMNNPRTEHSSTLLPDGRVLLAGGYKGRDPAGEHRYDRHAQVYDPATNAYTAVIRTLDDGFGGYEAPIERRWRHSAVLDADGTRVWLDGGVIPDDYWHMNATEYYDIALNQFWPAGGTNIEAVAYRWGHTAIFFPTGSHRVLIGGTRGGHAEILFDAHCYPDEGGWRTPLHQPRSGHSSTLLPDGSILIAGGYRPRDERYFMSAELLSFEPDPTTGHRHPGKSERAGPLHVARAYHSATLLSDGRVLVCGGVARTTVNGVPSIASTNSAEIYDPEAWTFAYSVGSLLRPLRRRS